MSLRQGVGCASALVALAACGNDHEQPITWYQSVAPILSQHYVSCHSQGGVAPFRLDDYATAQDYSQRMLVEIDAGTMQPLGARATSDCAAHDGWLDDPRVTPEERFVLQEWVDRDYPVGTVADIP